MSDVQLIFADCSIVVGPEWEKELMLGIGIAGTLPKGP